MNIQRAIELSVSAEQANVSFQDMPVMIQHVDESNETARIYEVKNFSNALQQCSKELTPVTFNTKAKKIKKRKQVTLSEYFDV